MHTVFIEVPVQAVVVEIESLSTVGSFLEPLIELGGELCELMWVNTVWIIAAHN